MPLWKNIRDANSAPKFITDAATGETGVQEFGTQIFYIDGTEGYPVAPGWARKTIRGSRTLWESVAAIRTPFIDLFIKRLSHRLYGAGYNSGAAPLTGDGTQKTYSATFVNESGFAIDAMSVMLQGWTLRTTGTTDTGNTFTVTGNVEYPVGGTTTDIGSIDVLSGENTASADLVPTTIIPAGDSFKVNLFSTVPNGLKYISNLGFAGLRTHNYTSKLRKLALFAIGDSIITNNNGAPYTAATGKCPIYQVSISGTTAQTYGASSAANFVRQADLAQKLGITHFLSNFGTNDFGAATSLANLQSYLTAMKTLANSKGVKFAQTTMTPRTTAVAAVAATMTSSGTTITATVPDATKFTVGNPYIIAGAVETEYNGNRRCASVDTQNNTVTFVFPGSATSPATGSITINQWKATFQPEWMSNGSSQYLPGPNSDRGLFNTWVREGGLDDYIEWADAVEPSRDSGRWLVAGESPFLPTPELITVSSVINTSRFNSNYSRGSSTIPNGFVAALTGANIGTHRTGNGNTNGDITVNGAWTSAQQIGDQYYAVPGVSYMSDDGLHPRVAAGGKGGQVLLDNATSNWITARSA